MPSVAVLVPAGGIGTRLGHRTPKQFLRLGGATILTRTLANFLGHPAVRAIVVAAPAEHLARTRRLVARVGRRPVSVVAGGATRQESVWRALQAAPADVDIVLVHDAVRPFIDRRLIDAVVAAAVADGAAICALPIAETIKRVRDGVVEDTLDRSGLWAVQTPQAFRTALLREAHDKARRDGAVGTDDAMLVEWLGQTVRVVPGLAGNVKITTPEDLRRARGRR
jgi:2-C-methyl-D-erythritol 4-phosphate cytidylyltransferase